VKARDPDAAPLMPAAAELGPSAGTRILKGMAKPRSG